MRARLVSRVITGIYDDVLRPYGIQSSQLNLLAAIAQAGPVRRSDLGRAMHIDASTLTRNLRVMESNGWIEEVADPSDGRGAPVRIAKLGEALLARVAPSWRSAQRRAAALLGSDGTRSLTAVANDMGPFAT